MYCKHCGKEVDDKAVVCPHCGCSTGQSGINGNDSDSIGWGILGFIFPVIGLILWLVWKDECPMKAHRCGKGALISVIVDFVLWIILIGVGTCSACSLLDIIGNMEY